MKLTLAQHIEKMKRVVAELENADRPVLLASGSAIARFSERVFIKGQDINGGSFIYDYKKPLYVNPLKSPGAGFEPKGKPRKSGDFFKSGKNKGQEKTFRKIKKTKLVGVIRYDIDLKTRWFPSYQAYREKIGREAGFVNWVLSGDLKSEIENRSLIKIKDAEYEFKVTSPENKLKLEGKYGTGGLKKKYPGVFQLSPTEKKAYFAAFDKEFLKLLKEKLR